MSDYCITCGMPLDEQENIGNKLEIGSICKFCIKEDGTSKSCEDIFQGGVQFFVNAVSGTSQELAERVTRKNMNRLPYWKENRHECLNGEQATDEEFAEILKKLHNK